MRKIYYNANIVTMEKDAMHADAMLVEDGCFKAVGTKDEIFAKVKKAIQWLLDVYPHPEKIDANFDGKQVLDELSDSDAAKVVRHSADYINKDLSSADPKTIDLETVRKFQTILTGRPLNGDGVLVQFAPPVIRLPAIRKPRGSGSEG